MTGTLQTQLKVSLVLRSETYVIPTPYPATVAGYVALGLSSGLVAHERQTLYGSVLASCLLVGRGNDSELTEELFECL